MFTTQSATQFSIKKHQTDATLILRVSSSVQGVTAARAFKTLCNYSRRSEWDFLCKYARLYTHVHIHFTDKLSLEHCAFLFLYRHSRVFRDITTDDHIIHIAMRSPQPEKRPKDFVLLACERDQLEYDGYVHTLEVVSMGRHIYKCLF